MQAPLLSNVVLVGDLAGDCERMVSHVLLSSSVRGKFALIKLTLTKRNGRVAIAMQEQAHPSVLLSNSTDVTVECMLRDAPLSIRIPPRSSTPLEWSVLFNAESVLWQASKEEQAFFTPSIGDLFFSCAN